MEMKEQKQRNITNRYDPLRKKQKFNIENMSHNCVSCVLDMYETATTIKQAYTKTAHKKGGFCFMFTRKQPHCCAIQAGQRMRVAELNRRYPTRVVSLWRRRGVKAGRFGNLPENARHAGSPVRDYVLW